MCENNSISLELVCTVYTLTRWVSWNAIGKVCCFSLCRRDAFLFLHFRWLPTYLYRTAVCFVVGNIYSWCLGTSICRTKAYTYMCGYIFIIHMKRKNTRSLMGVIWYMYSSTSILSLKMCVAFFPNDLMDTHKHNLDVSGQLIYLWWEF